MKPSELVTLCVEAIKHRMPVLVKGKPGIGKSDLIAQAANLAGASILLSHPAVEDPTDTKGLPWIVDGEAHFVPFGGLRTAVKADKPLVWFFDDLGQATAAVQAAKMQLLLARQVDEHVLSEHVTFIAATNDRKDRAGVSGILEPVKSRFATIVQLDADIDEWSTWALDHDLPAELIAFLRFRSDLLSAFEPTADLTNTPSPRTWSHVAKWMRMYLPPTIRYQAFAGAVGDGAAAEFTAFLSMLESMPSLDAILANPANADVPTEPSVLYAVSSGLAAKTTVNNFAAVATYINRMMQAGRGEFAVLTIKDALRRTKDAIKHTQPFVKLMANPEYSALVC